MEFHLSILHHFFQVSTLTSDCNKNDGSLNQKPNNNSNEFDKRQDLDQKSPNLKSNEISDHEFTGTFSTATGRNLTVSDESIKKAQNLLNNIDKDESTNFTLSDPSFQMNHQDRHQRPDYNIKEKNPIVDVNDDSFVGGFSFENKENPNFLNEHDFIVESISNHQNSFTFASGKSVPPISEKSIQKANDLLENKIINTEKLENVQKYPNENSRKTYPLISEDSLRNNYDQIKNSSNEKKIPKTSNLNFTFASGKPTPKISEKSLNDAKKLLFNDTLTPETNNKSDITKVQINFISNDFLSKNVNENMSTDTFTGSFTFASGKPGPKVSEETLRNAQKKYLDNQESVLMNTDNYSAGFLSASGKNIIVSKESLEKAKDGFGEFFIESNTDEINTNEFKGFSLASGKNVEVSEEMVKKAQQKYFENSDSTFTGGFSLASGKNVEVSEEALKRAENLLNDETISDNPAFMQGFYSASGKNISVSDESMRKAQNLLVNDQGDLNNGQNSSLSYGFSFASGKSAPISEESIKKAQNFLNFDNEVISNNTLIHNNNTFAGFSFSSGKNVPTISDESLRISQQIFENQSNNTLEFPNKPKTFFNEADEITQNSHYFSPVSSQDYENISNIRKSPQFLASPPQFPSPPQFDNSPNSLRMQWQSPSKNKFSPTAMALAKAAGISPIKQMTTQNSGNSTPSRSTYNNLTNIKNSIPMSVPYQNRQGLLKNEEPSPSAYTPNILRNVPAKQRKPFKPPKPFIAQENHTSNSDNLTKIQKIGIGPPKQEAKPFFEMKKVHTKERITLETHGRYHGPPSIHDTIFLPRDAETYRFEDGQGSADCFVALIEMGFDPLLLKPIWLKNHYKWIVWKLKNLDLSYPNMPQLLTYTNVLNELKYRAQTEILDAKRSCVRLIYERDGPPSAYMILVVSDILPDGCLELSDGWYSIPATIDTLLSECVKNEEIVIGMKLRICCAQLDGDDASGPLDEGRNTRMILRINSVRRARWDSLLGYQKCALFAVSISSLVANGGPLPYIEVVVQRKYPFLYREAPKEEGGIAKVRTQDQQSRFEQAQEQKMSETIEKLRNEWQKELDEEGTDASNSSVLLRKYLKATDQNAFLSSIVGEERIELNAQIERHNRQQEDFMRTKAEEYIRENSSEFTTLFSLLVTDLCPKNHSDAEVSFWRMSPDIYEEIKEGMAIRIFGLESSETRGDRLSSRGQSRFEKVEVKHASTIFRKRRILEKISDILFFSLEMQLPVGTEFDFIGFFIKSHNNVIYLSDGSPVIAAIDMKSNELKANDFSSSNNEKSLYGICYIENARFQAIDTHTGVAHFAAYDTTIISRSITSSNKYEWKALQKLRELVYLDPHLQRIEELINGNQIIYSQPYSIFGLISNKVKSQSNANVNSNVNLNICTVCDFDTIDCLYNENGKAVFCIGAPFVSSSWKSRFIETREEFDRGLNIIIKVSDGCGFKYLNITQLTVNSFFNVIGILATQEDIRKVTRFYTKYFQSGTEEMKNQRNAMKNRFSLDISNVEAMLRATMFHLELIYDEEDALQMMRTRRADLIFPFDEDEWSEFQLMMKNILIGKEFQFELFDDGKMNNEYVSIVSSISTVPLDKYVRTLISTF
ncbi:BRCA2 repeat family protein [Tritrichomonas foetus]|uniref:BRCA2 repeat family protein n=1 Tax=Tritrichomonas foetus TaxID=1144522 RepID=A0A1J4K8V0_9EUKA|nr:BRCA2 repeat family protein [Tritrichomonas foetus]|eukprot:OHT06102.1 BRCA2 repeat family protein [Tritrichomonas foetus]